MEGFENDASHSQIIILMQERTLDIDLTFCCASLVVGGHEKGCQLDPLSELTWIVCPGEFPEVVA